MLRCAASAASRRVAVALRCFAVRESYSMRAFSSRQGLRTAFSNCHIHPSTLRSSRSDGRWPEVNAQALEAEGLQRLRHGRPDVLKCTSSVLTHLFQSFRAARCRESARASGRSLATVASLGSSRSITEYLEVVASLVAVCRESDQLNPITV